MKQQKHSMDGDQTPKEKSRNAPLSGRPIVLDPVYGKLAGTLKGAIVSQKMDFWFSLYPNGFYKLLSPASGNPKYRIGDSWTEELGFSEKEFRAAFDRLGVRHSKGSIDAWGESADKFIDRDGDERFYCSVYSRQEGITYYYRNHKLIDARLAEIKGVSAAKSGVDHLTKGKMVNSPKGRWSSDKRADASSHADKTHAEKKRNTHLRLVEVPLSVGSNAGASEISYEQYLEFAYHLQRIGGRKNGEWIVYNPPGLATELARTGRMAEEARKFFESKIQNSERERLETVEPDSESCDREIISGADPGTRLEGFDRITQVAVASLVGPDIDPGEAEILPAAELPNLLDGFQGEVEGAGDMKSEAESAVLARLCARVIAMIGATGRWDWARVRTWFVESGDNMEVRVDQWPRFYELVRASLMTSDPDIVARFDQIDRAVGESSQSKAFVSCT